MRTNIVIATALGLAASALLAQQKVTPLNIKTGLWQSTTTITASGSLGISPEMAAQLTPEQRARMEAAANRSSSGQPHTITDKGCIQQEDLTRDPFNAGKNDMDMKCSENLISSTSSDAEVEMSCNDSKGNTGDFHITFHATDNEHVTGTGHGNINMYGHAMKSDWNMQSQWVQASCPAGQRQ